MPLAGENGRVRGRRPARPAAKYLTNVRTERCLGHGTRVAKRQGMSMQSRCFTVRPTAAPRETFSVLVIDRTVREAEEMCATLREDGHLVDARSYGDDLVGAIAELRVQAIVIRMRLGTSGRAARDRIKRAFPHLLVIPVNASNLDDVRDQLPTRWTDLYELSAPPPPRLIGQPRAIREALEEQLAPRYAQM